MGGSIIQQREQLPVQELKAEVVVEPKAVERRHQYDQKTQQHAPSRFHRLGSRAKSAPAESAEYHPFGVACGLAIVT
jgi:hypothetical protein